MADVFNDSIATSSNLQWFINTSTIIPSEIYTRIGPNQPINPNPNVNVKPSNSNDGIPSDTLLLIILSSILAVTNIVTNILTLALILTRRHLRTVANTIIASMFVCHLFYSFFYTIPYVVFKSLEMTGRPRLSHASNIYCQMLIFVLPNVFSVNMNFHICAIAMERFISISAPFWYQDVILNWKSIVFVTAGLIWLLSLLIGFYPYLDGLYIWQPHACVPGVDPATARYLIPWNIFITVFRSALPLVFICIFYWRIYRIAKRKTIELVNPHPNSPRQTGSAYKAAKVIAVIIGVFIVCKLPRDITNLIRTFDHSIGRQEILQRLRYWCEFVGINLSSSINPLLYTYLNNSFRKELKLLIRRYKIRRDRSYLSTKEKPTQARRRIRSSKKAESVLLKKQNKASNYEIATGSYQNGSLKTTDIIVNRTSTTFRLEKSQSSTNKFSTQEKIYAQYDLFLNNNHPLDHHTSDDYFGLENNYHCETVV
ncbi:Adenosine receptor A2a [Trichoplax sp. H2]|uniref:G-protein coupled receptors family 1 profile domain-containing protein n=1 Tax=Trichoplax adhaerens TaxID=10228 RepID=B3S3U4_TRIAD|nr:predicted protein [Trichoplax adhaerens]EDV22345.1 predicted protein [Trichoplax adhaerens]RDD38535.1 Adenosine receptor A2a [Trichoplax sp. H2]|eukprot:XP_002114889.1 predicted protein [Trichoplax adhaerens]